MILNVGRNVLGSMDHHALTNYKFKHPLPILGQSINEEPFHSEDLSEGTEEENDKVKIEDAKDEIGPKKATTNFFFVHKRVKNNRQSILADRPLTIFKANTRKESIFRFFSPPPTVPKMFKKEELENAENVKSNSSIKRKLDHTSLSKFKKKRGGNQNNYFKKVVLNVARKQPESRKFQLKGKLNFGV